MRTGRTSSKGLFAAAFVLLAAGGCRSASSAATATPSTPTAGRPSPSSVVAAMTRVADWQLANPSSHKLWEWHQAPFWASLEPFAPLSRNPKKYLDAIAAMGEANEWNHGPSRFHADDQAITQSYFLLHARRKDPRMIAAALKLFDEMTTMPFDEPCLLYTSPSPRD